MTENEKEQVAMTEADDGIRDPRTEEIIGTLERLSEHGHAPLYHCSQYAFGNDEKIESLRKRYLDPRTGSLSRGGSAEKIVRGESGSGKTHFISQLLEKSREMDYMTAMVKLTADANITSYNSILRMVAQELCPPDTSPEDKGMRGVMASCIDRIAAQLKEQGGESIVDQGLASRAKALKQENFEHGSFGSVASYAIQARLDDRLEDLEAACRWMSGELDDRQLAKRIGAPSYTSKNIDYESKRVLFSIYQFIRRSGYAGTAVGFDETDHGWTNITSKHKQVFNSLLQSDINSIVDTNGLSVFICYAVLPEIYNDMMNYPALQGRIQPPMPDMTFEKGYPNCPVIVVSRSPDIPNDLIVKELQEIGYKLVDMLYDVKGPHQKVPEKEVRAIIDRIAEDVVKQETSTSNRRMAVRWVASELVALFYDGAMRDHAEFAKEKEDEGRE
jgi:hypothetical protein